MLNQLLQPFQIGDIYISLTETNPASKFGGTWERIESAFLYGADSIRPIGTTGGEDKHTLTINEMPSHNHKTAHINEDVRGVNDPTSWQWKTLLSVNIDNMQGWNISSEATGGSQPHNNMPPYLAVYIWKRTA